MTAFLTKAQVQVALSISPQSGGFVTFNGVKFPWRPVSTGYYLRYVVARFDAPKAFYVLTAHAELASAAIEAAKKAKRDPNPEDLAILDSVGYLTANATDQAQADAAMVACGIGHPGDEDTETMLLGTDDEELERNLQTIEKGSWGDNPGRFFGVVARKLSGRRGDV